MGQRKKLNYNIYFEHKYMKTIYPYLWATAKTVFRKKFIDLNDCFRK